MSLASSVLKHSDPEFQAEIQRAIEFATDCHRGQTRKVSHLPYICHPLAVLSQIADWECYDLTVWKAAVCHDIAEDTDFTLSEIIDVIGYEAGHIVEELTFLPTTEDERERAAQKRQYMAMWGKKDESGVWIKSLPALIIKVADRMVNTVDFLSTTPAYAGKYWKKAESLIDGMSQRRQEIIEVYGENVWARMRYTQTTLTPQLY